MMHFMNEDSEMMVVRVRANVCVIVYVRACVRMCVRACVRACWCAPASVPWCAPCFRARVRAYILTSM